ncbi:MAG: hypothetical protein II937_16815 [Bacteroidales bacterium]|nr:hypothetical protein [Bacteroidales bacterium]
MIDKPLSDNEDVVRAIFSPLMIDENGNLSRAAFSLRHNEDYISVCRTSVPTWLEDVHSIPENENRKLFGYCVLNVFSVRSLGFYYRNYNVCFEVCEKHTPKNKSHAGIFVLLNNQVLKGDRKTILKNIPEDVPSDALSMRYQRRLLDIAAKKFIVL